MAPTTIRKSYTAAKKLKVVEFAEEHGNRAAERMFGCSEANVRSWRKDKVKIQTMPKFKKAERGKPSVFPELEEKLALWIRDRQEQGVRLMRTHIQRQSLEIAVMCKTRTNYQPILKLSWFNRFMKRHGLSIQEPEKDPRVANGPAQNEKARPTQKEKARPTQKEKELPTQKEKDIPTQNEMEKGKEAVDEVSTLCKNIADMSTGPKEFKKESVVNVFSSSLKTGSVVSVCQVQKNNGKDKPKIGQMKCSKITAYFKVTAREEKSEIKFDIHKKIKEEPIF